MKHRHSVGLGVLLCLGLCGCPNSPLAEILSNRNNNSNVNVNSNGSAGQEKPAEVPVPYITFSGLTSEAIRIEWAVDEELPEYEDVFGYNLFRSEEPDRGFTLQAAYARFEQLAYLDEEIRGGTTYYYYVVALDRLGNLGPPSKTVALSTPLDEDQIIVRANAVIGELPVDRIGVTDLNLGNIAVDQDPARTALRDLGTARWRISLGRWDAGMTPTQQEMIDREIFTGDTLAQARDEDYYDWTYLDEVVTRAMEAEMTPLMSIDTMPRSLAKNTEVAFKAPVLTWSDNIRNSPPTDPKVFAEFVKHVIMHYTEGWDGGFELDLPDWELWHAPDIDDTFAGASGIYWAGTQEEFFETFAETLRVIKQEWGDSIRLGGAAFANPESVKPFLAHLQEENLEPDFVSYIVNADSLSQIESIVTDFKDAIEGDGLLSIPQTVVSAWNMALPLPGVSSENSFYETYSKFDSILHAIHYLESVRIFTEEGVHAMYHDSLWDLQSGLNSGLLTRDSTEKPVSILRRTLQELVDDHRRLRIEPAGAVALAGINDDETSLTLILANPETDTVELRLDVRDLPWGRLDRFDWTLRILSEETFEVLQDYGDALGGSVSGRSLSIAPTLPESSILVLRIALSPETEAADGS